MQEFESPELKAAVTFEPEKVDGAIPIFLADNNIEAEQIAEELGKILQGIVHKLDNGVYVIVKH